jgi:cytochrome c551/c552
VPETPAPPVEEKDPVTTQSYSGIFLWASILLILSLFWALYDEVYGLRPWKSYQRSFVKAYTAYLKKLRPEEKTAEEAIKQTEGYQELDGAMKAAEKNAEPRVKELDHQVSLIDRRMGELTDAFQVARSKLTAKIYEIENASSAGSKASLRKDVDEIKKGPYKLELPGLGDSGKREKVSFNYDQLEAEFERLKALKADALAERVNVMKEANELRKKRDEYLADRMLGLTEQQVNALLRKMETFTVEIKQVNVPEHNIVDRCESCHVGIREPLALTKKDMGGEEAFVSHPEKELLKIHDPEKFGCSPCHNGNGRATTSVERGHGRYEHWLWPLHPKENTEAGCVQCHVNDVVLDHADTLNAGREYFMVRGCMGCHRYEGYDREPEQLLAVRQNIRSLEAQKLEDQKGILEANKMADAAASNEEAQRLYRKADGLKMTMSTIDAKIEQLDMQSKNLLREQKKVGPNLKDVRLKLRKEWIPVWLEQPTAFRPTTKMPNFRISKDDREAIAAFIWQSGTAAQLPKQPMGDPKNGKELFETRGCLACHSIGDGNQKIGGTFAANLSRVGEKVNYDYLVRWIHNPRERTLPYCPYEKKDITEEDYKKHGLPYVFDLDHTKCPNDGHELQVQQMTVMPSLRLSTEDVRDIASFLMTQKHDTAVYPPAPFLDDPKLKARGAEMVKFYGCAGCHEIAGFEEEGRIGTDLTKEGSKPIDNFDFALLTRPAKNEGWYTQKGFFAHKLKQPELFDTGKIKSPKEVLRMPNPHLETDQITALTTFLMGSIDSPWGPGVFYNATGQAKDIQDGWWIVKKYNCMGCHQLRVGQRSVLMDLPRYQDPDWKEQLPPQLVGEGARVNPRWLEHFVANPALDPKNLERNGVRSYLKARMPTFYFSDDEVRKLVRFFMALSSQAEPYIPQKLEELTSRESAMARELFTSKSAPCLACHATGDPAHDKTATAPNFLLAKDRLKPGWTSRWIADPAMISPVTSMPSNLFKLQADHYVFSGPLPDIFKGYGKDQIELLVRYLFEMTPEEQRRLLAKR